VLAANANAAARARLLEARARAAWMGPAIFGAIALARVLILPRLGLFNDEAYYWEWSRHLAPSYYDHPPAVAFAIAASTHLLGQTALAVHLPAFFFSVLTSAVLFRLALDLFPGRRHVAWWAVVASNAAPLFGIGAVFTTPDAPATFCWVTATWLAWRATHGTPRAWYLAGAAVGAGLLSKYAVALFPLALAAYLALPRNRHWWARREPWLAALLAAAIALPVLAWNRDLGVASVSFQLVERHLGPWQPLATLRRFVVAQQAISPLLWLLCMAALVRSARLARRGSDVHAFLVCGAATVLGFFGLFALHTWVNPNWTGIAYVPLLLSAADLARRKCWWVRVLPVLTAGVATAAFYAQALWLPFPLTGRGDLAGDLHGWEEVGARLRALRATMPEPARTFAYARRFQYAALAAFNAGEGLEVTRLGGARRDAYDAWRDDERLRGEDAILFADDWNTAGPDRRFARCEPAGELPIVRGGRRLRTFSFWRCFGFAPD
jgi:dolichyl-phosphate-mannose-protein mannosyltransferase